MTPSEGKHPQDTEDRLQWEGNLGCATVSVVVSNEKLRQYSMLHHAELHRMAMHLIYQRALQRVSLSVFLRNVFDVETVQEAALVLIDETYIRADRCFGCFDPARGSFIGWYGAIMRHVFQHKEHVFWLHHCQTHAACNSSTPVQEALWTAYEQRIADEALGTSLTFNEIDKQLIEREWVNDLLSHLSEVHRAMVILYVVGGFRGCEIAEMFGCSPGCFRAQLRRALLFLRSIAQKKASHEQEHQAILSAYSNTGTPDGPRSEKV
jgi:DNA-directed RNA polymerase specialized sigma24 family protein